MLLTSLTIGWQVMAWSKEEAIQAGELLCVIDMPNIMFKGISYPVYMENGRWGVALEMDFNTDLSILRAAYNNYFEIKTIQLEND